MCGCCEAMLIKRLGKEPDADLARRFGLGKTTVRVKRVQLGIVAFRRKTNLINGLKKCCICHQEKPPSDFPASNIHLDGLDPRCRRCIYDANMEYNKEHPDIARARAAVAYAKKTHKLTPPTCCEDCRERKPLEAHHHHGYDREFWLDVRWLCRRCHRKADKAQREQAITT